MNPDTATKPHRVLPPSPGVLLFVGLALLTTGCAGLGIGRELPVVSVQSFRAVPGPGAGLPAFEIGLMVLNPNPEPLRLEGIAYSIRLDGKPLLDGVSNDMPVIDGYGQGTVNLRAAVNVLGGIRLVESLMRRPRDTFDYEFTAKLDPEGFSRNIRVTRAGRIDLTAPDR